MALVFFFYDIFVNIIIHYLLSLRQKSKKAFPSSSKITTLDALITLSQFEGLVEGIKITLVRNIPIQHPNTIPNHVSDI